jgi:hypothetical protein
VFSNNKNKKEEKVGAKKHQEKQLQRIKLTKKIKA